MNFEIFRTIRYYKYRDIIFVVDDDPCLTVVQIITIRDGREITLSEGTGLYMTQSEEKLQAFCRGYADAFYFYKHN